MQYLFPINPDPNPPPAKSRKPRLRKKAQRPVVENSVWPDSDFDRISHEVLSLCAQVRSEITKVQAHGGRRSQLLRATKSLAKPGVTRIFKQMAKNECSVQELAKRLGWSAERTMQLVSGQTAPGFREIPSLAAALKIAVPTLLTAYGYPADTFRSPEALAQAVLMDAERP